MATVRRRTSTWMRLAVGAVLATLLVACGGDSDDQEDAGGGSSPETTQPASSELAQVDTYLQDLLGAWDRAMTPILGDPAAVAADASHSDRRALAESFTADSPYVAQLGGLLTDGYVAQDLGLHPGPSGDVQQTTLLSFADSPDKDHLSFLFCTYTDGTDFTLSTGEGREPNVSIKHGDGEAIRVDGKWRLHRLHQLGYVSQPAGTPNPCPDEALPGVGQ